MRTTFLLLAALLIVGAASAQTGRRHTLRDTFTRFNSDRCFDLTREEGERAFQNKDWEAAAALFRAAKNCADADQTKRNEMNQRIRAAREANIAALVKSERAATQAAQEALHTARHAIATNRANDALLLLKDGHRSLAFRLADFADRYIAPPDGEPNTNTRQAMLDAWNYLPYYHSWMREYPELKVPFCFQVADNLHSRTQIHYLDKPGGSAQLYAFSPDDHLLRSWSADLTESAEPVRMDTTLVGFEPSPDGRTLAFYAPRRWVLWRSASQFFPIEVSGGASFGAFSADGNKFYFLERGRVMHVPIHLALGLRSGRFYQRNYQSNIAEMPEAADGITWPEVDTYGLLAFGVQDSSVYLAYVDRVLVLRPDTTLVCPMPYTLPADSRPAQVKFWLKDQLLTYANDTLFVRFRLPAAGRGSVVQEMGFGERLLAFSPQLTVTREPFKSRLFFRENQSAISHFSLNSGTSNLYGWLDGAVSPNGDRCALLNDQGVLRVFELEKTATGATLPYYTTADHSLRFTPDGKHFVVPGKQWLEVFRTDNLQDPVLKRRIYPGAGLADLPLCDTWVAYQSAPDSIELLHFQSGKTRHLPLCNGTFSSDGRFFAYNAQAGVVQVINLGNMALAATHDFGKAIYSLQFVPQSSQLMVLTDAANDVYSDDLDIRFWDTARPEREPAVLLLSEFTANDHATLSPDGHRIAITNHSGTRIFELSNLSEEYNFLRVQNFDEAEPTTMTFSPDGRLLLVGYADGHTRAWDVATRRLAYRLVPPTPAATPVVQLWPSPDGKQMIQVLAPPAQPDSVHKAVKTNTFVTRLLDFDVMRVHLSDEDRQLIALDRDQILAYDLEAALSYPGNFERLAKSGDLPLIRSFFDYYQAQATQSNNSAQVGQYCNRAFQLFQNLDPDTRASLRGRMLWMYNGMIWKLIQRNKPDDAASAVQHVSRYFDAPLDLMRWSGHIALLRGGNQLSVAANAYADWLIRSAEAGYGEVGDSGAKELAYNTLTQELKKMNTYGLLRQEHHALLCDLLGTNIASEMDDWCGGSKLPAAELADAASTVSAVTIESALDPVNRQRWRIFQGLEQIQGMVGFSGKIRRLEDYLADAQKLARQNSTYRSTVEQVALELARAHIAHGDFEQNNNLALRHYAQAIRTLQDLAPFKKYAPDFWSVRSQAQEQIGNVHLLRGNTLEATKAYEDCLKSLQKFYENTPYGDEITNQRAGEVLIQMGMVNLLENRPDDADTLFERARVMLPLGINNLYNGHAALLRGNRTEALLNYGDIQDAQQMGQVLAEIERMAERVPERRASMLEFVGDLRRAAATAKSEIDTVETQYHYANLQVNHFAAARQWDKARHWSREALRCADKIFSNPQKAAAWESEWLNAHLNAAYYHLLGGSDALSAAIRYSREAEERFASEAATNSAVIYLKTNLAHALLLRNGPGDREAAIQAYQAFVATPVFVRDNWEVLEKDFRDLKEAGVQWPADMPQVIQRIKPQAKGPDEQR